MSLVAEGIHTVRARTWTFKQLQKGGFFLAIQCVTEGGPPGLTGGKVYWSLFFDARSESTSLHVLRELGWKGDRPEECHDNGGGLDVHAVQVLIKHAGRDDSPIAVVERMLFADEELRRELSDFFKGVAVPPPRKPPPEPSGTPSDNNLDT